MNIQPYHLTPEELIFLLGLLEIEPLPYTLLADWLAAINYDVLGENEAPAPAKILLEKGWVWYDDQNWHMDDRLAQSLELIARATTNLTLHVQKDGNVAGSSYAQYQDQACRYNLTDEEFTLYPPELIQEINQSLLAEDLQPAGKLAFREELDLASLFVLTEACWQTARAGLFDESDYSFSMEDLTSGLETSIVEPASRSWLGLELDIDLERLSLHSIIQDLINRELLQHLPGGRLRLTLKSDPYNLIISDPEMFGLACTCHNKAAGEVELASWLFGSGEILQIVAVGDGQYQLNTLFSAQIIREWIQDAWKKFEQVEPPPPLDTPAEPRVESRKITGQKKAQSKTKTPLFFRLLRGLAGAALSTLVIGLLSSTIIGLIQGELKTDQIYNQMAAGVYSLASELNLPLLDGFDNPPLQAPENEAVDEGEMNGEPVQAEAAPTASSEEDLQAALAAVNVQEYRLVQDAYEDWYVVGILANDGEYPLSRLELEIQIQNSNGAVLYTETGITRTSVQPGEKTSFDTYLYGWEGGENLQVEIIPVSAELSQNQQPAEVDLANLQIFPTGYRGQYVTVLGEMINLSDQEVVLEVGSLLRDEVGQLVTGWHSTALQRILLPGERVPFSIRFNPLVPLENPNLEENLELFVAGRIADDPLGEPAIRFSREQNAYVDYLGDFHIAGQVLNEEDSPRRIQLIGAIYDEQGKLVDACTQWVAPRGLPSGSITNYDISCWFVVEDLDENPELRERVFTFDIMVERTYGRKTHQAAIPLEISELSYQSEYGYITFSGSLESTPSDESGDMIVILTVTNQNDGSLVAVYYAFLDSDTLSFYTEQSLLEYMDELPPEFEVSAKAYLYYY